LYYYHARYYDPFVGQFTQPDSLVADPLNPAAWNRFSYVHNAPTNYVDPSGRFPWVPLIVAGLIGGGLNVAAGYLTSDQYSTAQGLTDFAIGAAFGMAVYGVGAYFVPEFIGVSASTHFIGRATWGQAMTALRVTALVELNVLESVVAASVDDREYTSNDLASALFWGLFGAGVGEVLGYMTGRVTRELRFSRETYDELGRSYQRYARQWRNLLPDNSAKPRVLQATASYLRWSATQRARSAIPRFVRPFVRDAFPIAQWRTFAFLTTTTLGDPELLGALAPATPFEDPVLLNR
jgi:hypothetical protein